MNPVEEFLSLTKHASWLSNLGEGLASGFTGSAPSANASTMGRMLGAAGQGVAVSGLVAGAGLGVSKGIGAIKDRFAKARNFRKMIAANPTLQEEDAGHVQMLYNSLHRLSPTMAGDPILAGSFVRESLRMGPEGQPSVRFDTAKMLSETERNVAQGKKGHPLLDAIGKNIRPMVEPRDSKLVGTRRWENEFVPSTDPNAQPGEGSYTRRVTGGTENIYK